VQRIANVCGAYGVTLPQAAMAFPLRHPVVAGVVVGMRSAEEARRNAESFQAETPAHVWADLRSEGLLARSHLEWRLARYRNLAVQPLPPGVEPEGTGIGRLLIALYCRRRSSPPLRGRAARRSQCEQSGSIHEPVAVVI
jgi:hypothetical protein